MDYSLNVIIGAEYKTNAGDVIGLFLKHEYKETDCLTLIRKIKADGGVVILPHPFQGHKLTEEIVKEIDIIETFNPRCTAAQNQKAIDLATKFNKPQIAGADAHLMKELNKSLNILNGDVIITALFNEKEMITTYSSKFNFLVSQYIKALKKKEPVLFLKTTKSLISYYFIQPLRNRLKN